MTHPISTDRQPPTLPSSDRASAQQPSSESWQRTLEHAFGGGFDRWFQAPTERGDAAPTGARPAFAASAMSQPAGSMFAHARPGMSSTRAQGDGGSHDVVGRTDLAGQGARETAAGSSQEPAMVMAGLPATQALVAALGRLVEPVPVVAVDTSPQALPGGVPASRATVLRAGDREVAADVEAANESESAAPRDASATSEREPLRVHAEWSDNGVRVWMGADLQGLAAVGAVTRQLQQWLGRQGVRLLGVVCNGQEIWSSSSEGGREASSGAATSAHDETDPAAIDHARSLPFSTNLL
jgi:hypothetical protein